MLLKNFFLAIIFSLLLIPLGHGKSIKEARSEIVTRTLDYLAIPYLWGGENPDSGLDCSGFVKLIYAKTGLKLPRVSRDQFKATKYLNPNKILPGDLIFFAMENPETAKVDHVGIYVGKGFFVHASFSKGIHINHLSSKYYQQRLVGIRQYKGF